LFASIRATKKQEVDSFPAFYNPRTYMRCDSTYHTYAQRATCFNPRIHEGCDSQLCIS